MTIGIYRIVNKITGKCYVGQSQNIELRWKQHIYAWRRGDARCKKLFHSYQKHGEDAFVCEIVEVCSIEELDAREQAWIDLLDSFHGGYNSRGLADSNRGIVLSDETKQKMSESAKRTWTRAEVRAKRCASASNISEEQRDRKRSIATACWKSPEIRESMIAGIKARYQDPEFTERFRQSQIAAKSTTEARDKQRRVANEIYSRPGFLEKKSEMTKRDWADPEKKAIRVLKCRLTRASKKLVILTDGD